MRVFCDGTECGCAVVYPFVLSVLHELCFVIMLTDRLVHASGTRDVYQIGCIPVLHQGTFEIAVCCRAGH